MPYRHLKHTSKYRIHISDDHPIMADGLRNVVEGEFDVVGTSANDRSAQDMAKLLRPDGIIVGISFPPENALRFLASLGKLDVCSRILLYCESGHPEFLRETRRLGAHGWLLKTSAASEIIVALREILGGNTYIDPGLFDQSTSAIAPKRLTRRQTEVLRLVAEGKSAREIGVHLNISRKTVEFHKAAILTSLQVESTAQAIRYTTERGMLGSPWISTGETAMASGQHPTILLDARSGSG